jgi:arginase
MTAVAVDDGYECHACGAAFAAGLVRVPRAWGRNGEEMAAAAALALPYPETASVGEETLAEQNLALAAALPVRPLVLGGCCCAHIGAVEGLAARHDRLAVVWIDAHGDLNTPESSPSGNAWGMPLRMLLDAGTVAAGDTVLVAARNLDPPEEEFIDEVSLPVGADAIDTALEDATAVYVALDADSLDPGEGIEVFVPEPDGLSLDELESLLRRIAARKPLVGAGLTGLAGSEQNPEPLVRLCSALGF